MVIAGPSRWGGRHASMNGAPCGRGAGGHGFRGQEAGIDGPGQVVPGRGTRRCFRWQGCVLSGWDRDQGGIRRPGCPACGPAVAGGAVTWAGVPVPVGWDSWKSGPAARRALSVVRARTAPPAGPRAPGWTGPGGSREGCPVAGVGGRAIPPPSARHGLADRPRPVQVVRPAGRFTCTGRERPAPRRVADGDGMTRPRREVRVRAPGKTTLTSTSKNSGNGDGNDCADRRNNCLLRNDSRLTR